MVDQSGKGGGQVVRGDVGCMEVLWIVRWNMGSVYGGGYIVRDLVVGRVAARVGATVCPGWVEGK